MKHLASLYGRLGVLLALALLGVLPASADRIDITTLGAVANNPSYASANATAIQNAIDNSPGAQVYIPAGTFYLNKPITLDQSNTSLVGVDSATSILQAAPGYKGMTIINQAWYMQNMGAETTPADRPLLTGIYDGSVSGTRYGLRDYTEYPNSGNYHTGVSYWGPWQSGYQYSVGMMITNNGAYYVCTQAHTSDNTVTQPGAGSNWTAYWSLRHVMGDWQTGFNYGVGDVVQNGLSDGHWANWGAWYVCIQAHTSDQTVTQPGSGSNWTAYWARRRQSWATFDASPFAGGTLLNSSTGQVSHFNGLDNFTLDIGVKNNNSIVYKGSIAQGPYTADQNAVLYIGTGTGNTLGFSARLDNGTSVSGGCSEQIQPGEVARLTLQMKRNGDGSHTLALWSYNPGQNKVILLCTATMAPGRTLAANEVGSLVFGGSDNGFGINPSQYSYPEDMTYFGFHLSADARYQVGALNSQQLEADGVTVPNDQFRFFDNSANTLAFVPFTDNWQDSTPHTSSDLYRYGNLISVQFGAAAGDATQQGYGWWRTIDSTPGGACGGSQSIHDLGIKNCTDTEFYPWGIGIDTGYQLNCDFYNLNIRGGYYGIGAWWVGCNSYTLYLADSTLQGVEAAFFNHMMTVTGRNLTIPTPGRYGIFTLDGGPMFTNITIGSSGWTGAYTRYLVRSYNDWIPYISNITANNSGQAYPSVAAFSLTPVYGNVSLHDCSVATLPSAASFLEIPNFSHPPVGFETYNNTVTSVSGGSTFASFINNSDPNAFGRIYTCSNTIPVQTWVDTTGVGGYANNNVQTVHQDLSSFPPATKTWTREAHIAYPPYPGQGQPTEYRCTGSGTGVASTWVGLIPGNPNACAAPTFSPTAGVYASAQTVTISSTTGGASIRYTTDGTNPTETTGTLYTGPVTISSSCTLKAMAYATGYSDSSVTSGAYTIGGVLGVAPVTVQSCNFFRHQLNGNQTGWWSPGLNSTVLALFNGNPGHLDTCMGDSGGDPSLFVLDLGAAASVGQVTVLNADLSVYADRANQQPTGVTVYVTNTDLSTQPITYNADGSFSVPGAATPAATGSLTLSTPTVQATTNVPVSPPVSGRYIVLAFTGVYAVRQADGIDFAQATLYTYGAGNGPCAAPTFTPAAGTYGSAQTVTISSTTGGASIRYTTDGTTPTETTGTLYTGPVTISSSCTLKAMAYATGYTDSPVTSGTYSILGPAPVTVLSCNFFRHNLNGNQTGWWSPGLNSTVLALFNGNPGHLDTCMGDSGGDPSLFVLDLGAAASVGQVTVLNADLSVYADRANQQPTGVTVYVTNTDLSTQPITYNADGSFSVPGAATPAATGSLTLSTPTVQATTNVPVSPPVSGRYVVLAFTGVYAVRQADGIDFAQATLYTYGTGNGPCTAPTFTPAAGTYGSAQNVTISTTTGGASIRYTTDGTTPTETTGTLYTGPVTISSSCTLKAMAYATGYSDSSVTSGAYTISGVLAVAPVTVQSCNFFRHQLNGNQTGWWSPGLNSVVLALFNGNPGHLDTCMGDSGGDPSLFVLDLGAAASVGQVTVLNADLSVYADRANQQPTGVTVYVTNTDLSTQPITYNADGSFSVPGAATPAATGSLTLSTPTVQATTNVPVSPPVSGRYIVLAFTGVYAVRQADGIDFAQATLYTYGAGNGPCAAPTFTPAAGTYGSAQNVTISTTTGGASIRYTTDGTTPSDTVGTVYSSAVSLTASCTLKAIAYKSGMGNSTVTTGVYTIDTAPTVSITAPTPSQVFTAPASIAITATASDTDGTISKVEFYNGANLLGTSSTSPYSFTWTNVAAGSYTLTAKAYDNYNLTTTSSGVNVISDTPPTVSLTAPAANTNYIAPASVALTATASDSDGTISKVEFYQGSTLVGTVSTSPYSYTWTNVAMGNYSLTAKAYDNNNVTTTSSAVNIIVWGTSDIGSVGVAGSASYSGSTFTVSGAGAGVTSTADAFRYVYRQFSGNTTIVARVASATSPSTATRAGVMMRQNLNANSIEASALYKPTSTYYVYFLRRTSAGGSTSSTTSSTAAAPPYWVKVVRSSNTLSAFMSANGSSWTAVGSGTTVTMTDPIYVGLAVTSGNTSAAKTVTFDNVSITQP